ncbi:MAG: hypothetical protein ACR2H4_03940 [Pyrinomonadaceae bacterium]
MTAGGPAFREGSLQVHYEGKDMELGGVVMLVDTDRSLIFDEELSEPMMFASSRLEGVWWLPSPKAELRLIVSNTSDAPLSANVSVDGTAPKQTVPEVLSLMPHETRVMDLQDLARKRRATLATVGGISVNQTGAPGALLARALIQEPAVGYSSVVEFSDPQTAKSSRLDGAGLRIGEIASEQLTQVAVARNVGDSPSVVNGRIPYTTSAGNAGEISLPKVRLAPGEVKEIKLAEAIEESGLKKIAAAGLQFEYSSQPGSVIMSALSVSSSGNQVFRVPLVDAKAQSSSTGKYPWSIEDSASTFVYLKNTTDHPQKYQLQINYEGGAYALGIKTIEAGQTMALDLRALRDNQVPDESGHTIPLKATQGQVFWSVDGRENLVLIGRAEQVDVAHGLSSTSACELCCPPSFFDGACNPSSAVGVPGDTTQFTATQRKVDCNGNILAPVVVASPSWSSTNTAVATVNTTGLATAQSPGTGNIQASWEIFYSNPGSGCACRDTCSPTARCCVSTSDIFTASATCDVAPRVTFSSLTAVGKGYTGSVQVTLNPSPSATSVTLTLSTTTGTGSAVFTASNSTTLTITQTTAVEIKGMTESSTAGNLRLEAKTNTLSLASENFTVLLVAISLRTSGGVSTDNGASGTYSTLLGTTNLGTFMSAGTNPNHIWRTGVEIVATVTPSNFTGMIILQRERTSSVRYADTNNGSTQVESLPAADDTSDPLLRDDDPQSGGSAGKIYDLAGC